MLRPLGEKAERDQVGRAARDLVAAPGVVRFVAERVEAVLHGHDLQSAVRLRGLGDDAADGELMVLKRCSSERGEREKRFYGDGKDEGLTAF